MHPHRLPAAVTRRLLEAAILLATLMLSLALAGCGDSTAPGAVSTNGVGEFVASVDPASGSVVLTTVVVAGPDGVPVDVQLIGRNLREEPTQWPVGALVSLDVSMLNHGSLPLYAPAEVVVHHVQPEGASVINADWARPVLGDANADSLEEDGTYGFFYSELLGQDRVLSPGEESGARTWSFRLPAMGAFSFGATARFGLEPDPALLGGALFWDADADGVWDPEEGPAGGGTVIMTAPSGVERTSVIGEDGRYEFPVYAAGLYSLRCVPPPTFAPVRFTTPNPLWVVLTGGANGRPESVLDANFGVANASGGEWPTVLFHEGPADSLEQDFYHLIDIGFDGRYLNLAVGFSGCGANHPLALYMVGGFMESNPVQARLVLSHDDRGELCDAYWTRSLKVDLRPIMDRYLQAYGHTGVVQLSFRAWDGKVTNFLMYPPN